MSPTLRILLVDDDPEIAWSVGRCLTRAGFSVITCGDGAEAIPLLEAHPFDVLVTDIQMPRLNGLTLVDWVRANRPGTNVVVMTAYGSRSVQRAAVSKGVILYLEKPVDPQVLIEVLRDLGESATFVGSVEGIDLFDCIQMVLLTRGRHVLEVTGGQDQRCLLWVDNGSILHGVLGELEGTEAVQRCLAFEGGTFATLPWREPERVSIDTSANYLLMEAARRKDEHDRPRSAAVPADQPPPNEHQPAARPDDPAPRARLTSTEGL
jgi:CheY-like chemotaxis protein